MNTLTFVFQMSKLRPKLTEQVADSSPESFLPYAICLALSFIPASGPVPTPPRTREAARIGSQDSLPGLSLSLEHVASQLSLSLHICSMG